MSVHAASSTTRDAPPARDDRLRVLVLGATGTAGRAATEALLRAGHDVTALARSTPPPDLDDGDRGDDRDGAHRKVPPSSPARRSGGAEWRVCDVTDPLSLRREGLRGERFDALVSCLASRSGVATDAWAIDHRAHVIALDAAREVGVQHMALLSALCVQKPRLAFQHAKLAFERELIDSGTTYSIVRPTAFFKSLSGQVERVRRGKPYLIFGDGTLTACKPISDRDLGDYIAGCLTDSERHDRILPIGGPGAAITPREQGERLFALTGRKPRFRQVPLGVLDAARVTLDLLGRVNPRWGAKAELARIARYYATESMLVLDPVSGRYDADATPSTGSETLFDFYAALLDGSASVERGEHAIFDPEADARAVGERRAR